jgi:DNA-binding transcriptional regulator GbsR (MarR family)
MKNTYILHKRTTNQMNTDNQTAQQKLKEIENKLLDILTDLSFLKGRQPKTSKIIGLIYLNRNITQKKLRELTGYSLGTISTNLQSLENMGIIHKTQDPQTREYNYELEGTIAQPESRSVSNIYEYFSQQKEFIKQTKTKLAQPHFSNKKGYENVKDFIDKMDKIFPAIEHSVQKILTQLSKEDRSTHT